MLVCCVSSGSQVWRVAGHCFPPSASGTYHALPHTCAPRFLSTNLPFRPTSHGFATHLTTSSMHPPAVLRPQRTQTQSSHRSPGSMAAPHRGRLGHAKRHRRGRSSAHSTHATPTAGLACGARHHTLHMPRMTHIHRPCGWLHLQLPTPLATRRFHDAPTRKCRRCLFEAPKLRAMPPPPGIGRLLGGSTSNATCCPTDVHPTITHAHDLSNGLCDAWPPLYTTTYPSLTLSDVTANARPDSQHTPAQTESNTSPNQPLAPRPSPGSRHRRPGIAPPLHRRRQQPSRGQRSRTILRHF